MRTRGKMALLRKNIIDNVDSDLRGVFHLENGVIHFSELQFNIPGTRVDLTGEYSLDGKLFDFHGKARLDARLSQMVTGWKRILLTPADPFFSKHGAGTELPVESPALNQSRTSALTFTTKTVGRTEYISRYRI